MITTFEARTAPGYLFTVIPTPLLAPLLLLGVFVVLLFSIHNPVQQAGVIGLALWDLWYIVTTWKNYSLYQVRKAMENGKELKRLPTFGSRLRKILADSYDWKTADSVELDGVGYDYLIHHDGSVSMAVEWEGVQDIYYSGAESEAEHSRRLSLLNLLAMDHGLFIEHHLLRMPDSRLVDAYEAEGRRMFGDNPMPPIVAECRQGIAAIARAQGRSNRVFTVLSMSHRASGWASAMPGGLLNLLPVKALRDRQHAQCAKELAKCWRSLQRYYPGGRVLGLGEYTKLIQRIDRPYSTPFDVEWRFPLNEQLITEKDEWCADDRCLQQGGLFKAVILLQGYPDLPSASQPWTHRFVTAGIDLHVSQILRPKRINKALDQANQMANTEAETHNERKSGAMLNKRVSDIKSYAHFVAEHRLPVLDNAYIVTFYGRDKESVVAFSEQFQQLLRKDKAVLRMDEDMQREMNRVRLPGMGRTSLFLREDHGKAVAAMMPLTTLACGSTEPEVLRVAMTGQIVGFSPSKVTIPHDAIVAMTGSGKDVNKGVRIAETYPLIRYDIVEMGNSYQGVIEAVGGRYCSAREQVINPLMAYSDFTGAVRNVSDDKNKTRIAQVLESQRTILAPIFNGMKGGDFSITQKVVMDKALERIYQHPGEGDAPTLPTLLDALQQVPLDQARYEEARNVLGENLYDFLSQGIGASFKERDQFVISPVANAIDFDKFSGELADFFLTFMCTRLANNAFARGRRSQIVLNEYKVLQEKSPDVIRWITTAIDRMGRKDYVGLTRISQGFAEIRSVDSEVKNSLANCTVLYRADQHAEIAQDLGMPQGLLERWQAFRSPRELKAAGYREAIVRENDYWFHLGLKFPAICLKLMDTDPENKAFREMAYAQTRDPYERIALIDRMKQERSEHQRKEKERYAEAAI